MASPDNKVVPITGASSRIGEGTARVLVAAGAGVVLGARRVDRLATLAGEIKAAGGQARLRALDVTKLDDMKAFADFARDEFGEIDVRVNNAGVMPLSPLAALKVDEWNWMIDVNIRGVLHGIAAVLPHRRRAVRGISSTSPRSAASSRSRPARSIRRPNSRCARFPKGCARRATRCAAPASYPSGEGRRIGGRAL